MKKTIKRAVFAATAFALCFAFTGCTDTVPGSGDKPGGGTSNWRDNMHREDNDFLEDDNRRPSREPFVDNTPLEEEGAVLTPYRFEAEAAKIRGNSNGEDHFCTGKSIEFSPSFSGNIALVNMGSSVMSYTFNSDKAVRSTMFLRIANRYGELENNVLSSHANITVNGKPVVDLSRTFDPESGEVASGCSEMYFKMITVETKVSLAQGKNLLEITAGNNNYLNMDYFEIQTSATLENVTSSTLTDPDSFINVTKAPTESATGTIAFDCHKMTVDANNKEIECTKKAQRGRTLPALTDGIYTKKELANGIQQTVKMFGTDAVITSTVVYNLTLQNATFADGTTTTGKVAPGATPALKYTEPDGQVFSHWEDAEGNNLGATFVMPEKDITIKPIFVVSNAVTVSLQGGTLNGESTLSTVAGREIDLSKAVFANQPEGTVLRYWYNVADVTEFYEDYEAFIVPANDITLAPAFDKAVYANRDGSTTGKMATFPYYGYAEMTTGSGTQPKDGYIRLLEDSGVKGRDAYWGFVGTGDNREMGAIYHWKAAATGGTLAKGFYFTPLSPYKVASATKYTISYTVQNQGTQEIKLRIYQTNSSGSPKPTATSTAEFTLAAGETKTVSITFTGFSNNNVLTTVELLTAGLTDLHIGMYQYIDTVTA